MNSKTDRKFPAHRKLTQAELMAEAKEQIGRASWRARV